MCFVLCWFFYSLSYPSWFHHFRNFNFKFANFISRDVLYLSFLSCVTHPIFSNLIDPSNVWPNPISFSTIWLFHIINQNSNLIWIIFIFHCFFYFEYLSHLFWTRNGHVLEFLHYPLNRKLNPGVVLTTKHCDDGGIGKWNESWLSSRFLENDRAVNSLQD